MTNYRLSHASYSAKEIVGLYLTERWLIEA